MILNAYTLTVRTEAPVPHDVLVEHVAVALRDFHFAGRTGVSFDSFHQEEVETDFTMARQHPFDGPEVFDDEPKPEYMREPPTTKSLSGFAKGGYTGAHQEGSFIDISPNDIISKRAAQMPGLDALEMMTEGIHKKDLTCHGGVHAEDLVLDPYPNVTEAAFQLREARKNDT